MENLGAMASGQHLGVFAVSLGRAPHIPRGNEPGGVAQRPALAANRRITSRIPSKSTTGLKSKPPMDGRTLRIGSSTGSTTAALILIKGLSGGRLNQESSTDPSTIQL